MTATVISGATSYKPEALRIFLPSAREYMAFARIVLIRDSADSDFLAAVRRYNPAAEVYVLGDSVLRRLVWRVAQNHREWCVNVGRLQTRLHLSGGLAVHALFLHIHQVRHIYAQLLLRSISSDFVLMADSRDVVFQANPFEGMGERLITGEEPMRIGDCVVNSGLVRTLYGEAMLERLAGCRILCAGVTYGPTAMMRSYVDAMVGEIAKSAPRIYLDYGLD